MVCVELGINHLPPDQMIIILPVLKSPSSSLQPPLKVRVILPASLVLLASFTTVAHSKRSSRSSTLPDMASLEFNAALAMSLTSSTFESIAVSLFRLENDASSVLLHEAKLSKIAVASSCALILTYLSSASCTIQTYIFFYPAGGIFNI